LSRLGTSAVRLAWAVAVLGSEATPALAAEVSGLSTIETAELALRLADARIFTPPRPSPEKRPLEFLHPLIATAVYRAIPAALRVGMHGSAAAAVLSAGRGSGAAGRHLLELHPEADPWVVRHLRAAAREYLRAGAPDTARRCLARALREPPSLQERPAVLYELGCAAQLSEPAVTVNHLRAALEEPALGPELRESIIYRLAQAYGHSGRMEEAAQLVAAEAGRA
ncbi:ATP-binding protein, partial [Streptomyces sp. MCAF7]